MGLLGDVQEHSRREHRDQQGRAAERDEWQRQAFRGQQTGHDTQVHERLGGDQHGDPERQVAAEGIGRSQTDPEPAPDEHDEEGDDGERAHQAELLADDREDEVGVRFREIEELLARGADALAEDSAVSEREPRLDDLEPAASRIGPRIDEREDAAQPVRRHPDRHHERRQRREQDEAEVTGVATGQEQERERERDERQTIAEIRLSQDEQGQDTGYRERRYEPALEIGDRLALLREKRGEIDDERELGQLGRLERDGPEPDPAPGAVDRLAERRDQYQHQEDAREDQERQDERLEAAIVDADRHPQAGRAEQRPEDLLLEKEVRIVEAVGRHDRARRVDHHHARREQNDGDSEKPDVGRELPGHLAGMGGSERW